jgi:serine protease Do
VVMAVLIAVVPSLSLPAWSQPPVPSAENLERAAGAVLGIEVTAVPDARSASTLGRVRGGSGVVIDDDLVLTIGYLVLEAEQVTLLLDNGKRLPARVRAYDLATGLALLQPLAPLKLRPAALGQSAALALEQTLMLASGKQDQRAGQIGVAQLAARRPFAGYWEYLIEDALFTTPATQQHSGAGLFNERGELVGIGSLFVQDVQERHAREQVPEQTRQPGNMFVPIDLLPPILGELKARGRSAASQRAWLGVNCVEQGGLVRVVRLSDDSPATAAGLRVGDVIRALDGQPVNTLAGLWTQLWKGEVEREVTLDVERDAQPLKLKARSVDRQTLLRRPQGI